MPPHCIVLYRSQEERFAIKEMAFGDGGGDIWDLLAVERCIASCLMIS
jgi:hypothetical protein